MQRRSPAVCIMQRPVEAVVGLSCTWSDPKLTHVLICVHVCRLHDRMPVLDCNYIRRGLATDCSAERGDGTPTMDFDAGDEMEVNGEGSLGLGEPADPLACLLGLASTNQLCAIDATMHDRSGSVGT